MVFLECSNTIDQLFDFCVLFLAKGESVLPHPVEKQLFFYLVALKGLSTQIAAAE